MLRQQFFLSENKPKQYTQEDYDDIIKTMKNNFPTSLNEVLTIISDLITGKLCQNRVRKFIILTGPYNSGKSTFLNILESIFKQYSISLPTYGLFGLHTHTHFTIPKLKNKLLVTINEFDSNGISDSKIKNGINVLTKSEIIWGRELYKNQEEIDITEMNILICMEDYEYANFLLKEKAITIKCENIDTIDTELYKQTEEMGNKLYSYILLKNKQRKETLNTCYWYLEDCYYVKI